MTGLAHNAPIVQKETFAPILYVLRFKVSLNLSLSLTHSLTLTYSCSLHSFFLLKFRTSMKPFHGTMRLRMVLLAVSSQPASIMCSSGSVLLVPTVA